MTKKNVKDWLKEHEQAMWHIAGLALGAGIGIGYLVITHRFRHSKDYVVQDETIKYILNCSENLERIISSNSQKIVDNIDTFRNTVLISSQKIMNEVLELKTKTLTIQDTYNKLKSDNLFHQ